MTQQEKKRFIRQLCGSVCASAISAVPKMPEDWDGHELREMLAELFNASRSSIMQSKGNQRHRNYKNERLVRNLP